MTNAYVLMTALPPTKGHLKLIQFASSLSVTTHVIVCTQPGEPYWQERLLSLQEATRGLGNVLMHHIHKELPQEPEQDPGFWDMWADFLHMFGFQAGDYIVASETYGIRLSEEVNGVFMPYDIERSIYYSKATDVRNNPVEHFEQILPEFQPYVRPVITVFGAESCGKTTLSKQLAETMNGHWLFEWARPFLETVGTEITEEKMALIADGQAALQSQSDFLFDKPFVFQDTDLFSTIGYWDMWSGKTPDSLRANAERLKSDFYIVAPSNIPFEADPLRYGGDAREGSDEYWISILEQNNLPYVVLSEKSKRMRLAEAQIVCEEFFGQVIDLRYDRITKETLGV